MNLIADPQISMAGRPPRTYITAQGGGWLGRFSLPIWVHLMATIPEEDLECILGTSVSALHVALARQGDLHLAKEMWDEIDDSNSLNGIKGFTSLSLRKGLWNQKKLRGKIRKLVNGRGSVQTRVGVVTRDPLQHYSLSADDAPSVRAWQEWVAASAAIAFVFHPVEIQLGSIRADAFDGGHLFSVPWIPNELRRGDTVHMVMHNPLDAYKSDVPPIKKSELMSNLRWLLWCHFKTGHWEALRRAERLAARGVNVHLWAPPEPLGDMLDAKQSTLQYRAEEGRKVVLTGPVTL